MIIFDSIFMINKIGDNMSDLNIKLKIKKDEICIIKERIKAIENILPFNENEIEKYNQEAYFYDDENEINYSRELEKLEKYEYNLKIKNREKYEIEYYIKVEERKKNNLSYDYEIFPLNVPLRLDDTKDLFDREILATEIAMQLINNSSSNPLNICVLGKWGQGKTFFMNLIRKKIEEGSKDRIKIINFDAATYNTQEKIWANLSTIIFKKYEQSVNFPKTKYFICKFKCKIKDYVENFILTFLIFGIIILLNFLKFIIDSNVIDTIITFSTLLFFLTSFSIPMVKIMLSSSVSLSSRIKGTFKLPNYIQDLGSQASITEEIELLLGIWLKNENSKLVLLIDDLDRCDQKGVLEFFQAIHLLQPINKINFIFAIDPEYLNKSIVDLNKKNMNPFFVKTT